MSAFQLGGLALSTLMAALSLRSLFARSGRRAAPLFWLTVWTAALAAFAFPDSTTVLARTLGIERGADMVLYSAALTGAVGFWLVSLRLRALNRQITELTRELALRAPRRPAAGRPGDLEPPGPDDPEAPDTDPEVPT